MICLANLFQLKTRLAENGTFIWCFCGRMICSLRTTMPAGSHEKNNGYFFFFGFFFRFVLL